MTETIQVGRPEYIGVADTAKLIRKALARAFPDYTFQVRSDSYSGGASVSVNWYDGPPTPLVDRVVKPYQGGGFDGMIDLAYSVESWLDIDGRAYPAGSPGTEGSRGVHDSYVADPPSPDARLVNFAADHVLTQRELTPEAQAVIDRKHAERYGPPEDDRDTYGYGRGGIVSRWLFPPCAFTFAVTHGYNDAKVVEVEGIPSKTAAEKVAKANQKAQHEGRRGYRHVTAHRGGLV